MGLYPDVNQNQYQPPAYHEPSYPQPLTACAPPMDPVQSGWDKAGRAVAKVTFGVGALGFTALGIDLTVKTVFFGVLTGVAISAGAPELGLTAFVFTVIAGTTARCSFKMGGHFFRQAHKQ